ncbi:MAG: DNA-3-methyladenine glycosylase [Candidatus Babeliales bacterium]
MNFITKIIDSKFFDRPVLQVSQELLGQYIIRKINNQKLKLQITEIEGYDGPLDLACHGRFGKTERTVPMFGPAGHFYVYLIYGIHWMLNIVTGPENYPAAILIRGTKEISGPGKLTNFLKIDKSFNSKLAITDNNLWFEKNTEIIKQKNILRTPRIGVDYAGPIWSQKPYRFLLKK